MYLHLLPLCAPVDFLHTKFCISGDGNTLAGILPAPPSFLWCASTAEPAKKKPTQNYSVGWRENRVLEINTIREHATIAMKWELYFDSSLWYLHRAAGEDFTTYTWILLETHYLLSCTASISGYFYFYKLPRHFPHLPFKNVSLTVSQAPPPAKLFATPLPLLK